MTTSGVTDLIYTRNEIILEVLELLGLYEPGGTPTDKQRTAISNTLNNYIKYLGGIGIGLWKEQRISLFQSYEGYEYTLGPGGDHAAPNAVKTEVATAAAAAATSLVIDATTGFGDTFDRDGVITATTPGGAGAITLDGALLANSVAVLPSTRKALVYSDGDDSGVTFTFVGTDDAGNAVTEVLTGPNATTVYTAEEYRKITSVTISGAGTGNIEVGCTGDHVGIELDDSTLQWTNIVAALSTTLTLLDALTDTVAVDNHVYSYTKKVSKPLSFSNPMLHYGDDDTEIELNIDDEDEYLSIPDKTSTGEALEIYLEPKLYNSTLSVWPACGDVKNWINMKVKVQFDDFDGADDHPDFPAEWFLPLTHNCAVLVAPKLNVEVKPSVANIAVASYNELKKHDRETKPVYMRPKR